MPKSKQNRVFNIYQRIKGLNKKFMDEDYFNIAETRIDNYELYKDLIKKK